MRHTLPVMALFVVLSACNSASGASDGGGTGGSGGTSGGAQACSDYATALCNLRQTCTNGFAITVGYGDLPTCQARYQASCENSLAAPGTGNTPAHLEACAQAMAGESCFDYFTNAAPSACAPPAGTLATGAGCAFDGQCQSGHCALGDQQICGSCQPPPQAGSSCAGGVGCGSGLLCLADTETCGQGVPDGGACTDKDACGGAESCVGLSAGGSGVCLPRGGVGSPCDPRELTAPSCFGAGGVYCVRGARDAGSCEPITVATAGQPCGIVPGIADAECGSGGLCAKAADAGTGSCVAYVSDGSSCDSVAGPPCLPPAKCVPASDGGSAGTCTLPNGSLCN